MFVDQARLSGLHNHSRWFTWQLVHLVAIRARSTGLFELHYLNPIMQIVYRPSDLTEAHIVAGLLREAGLEVVVGGHYLQGALGDIGTQDVFVIRVADADVPAALACLKTYDNSRGDATVPPVAARLLPVTLVLALFLVITWLLSYLL